MLITVSSAGMLIKFISYFKYGPYLPIPAEISWPVSGCLPINLGNDKNESALSRSIAEASTSFGMLVRFGFFSSPNWRYIPYGPFLIITFRPVSGSTPKTPSLSGTKLSFICSVSLLSLFAVCLLNLQSG